MARRVQIDPIMKTTRDSQKTETIQREFDVKDSKGRAIGARVVLFTLTYTEIPEDSSVYWTHAPGTVIAFCPQALRNGQKYGAAQSFVECKDEADREAKIEKYFAGARKRAEKLAAK